MEEIWKDVVGYEGLYEVSNFGNVRSLFRYKKQLKWDVANNRYAGEFIKEWPSAKDATTELGYESNHICECCKNKRKTSNGFRWKYKEVI